MLKFPDIPARKALNKRRREEAALQHEKSNELRNRVGVKEWDDPLFSSSFPAVPSTYIFSGDEYKAKRLRGIGNKRYSDLAKSMSFQGLETGFNTLRFANGTKIKTSCSYGLSTIEIYVPPIKEEPEKEPEPPCICCTDCLVVGEVVNNYSDSGTHVDAQVCQEDSTGGFERYVTLVPYMVYDFGITLEEESDSKLILFMIIPVISEVSEGIDFDSDVEDRLEAFYGVQPMSITIFRFFNCLSESGLTLEGVDLDENYIDTTQFPVVGDSCDAAENDIPIDDAEPPDTKYMDIIALPFNIKCMSK